MKTVGQILSSARLQKGLLVKDVAQELKTKDKYIEEIEKNNFSDFSSEIYAWGFVKMFSEMVGVKEDDILPYFRKQWNETSSQREIGQPSWESSINLKLEPVEKNIATIILVTGVVIIVAVFVIYIYLQYRANVMR